MRMHQGQLEVHTPQGKWIPEAEALLRSRENKLYQHLLVSSSHQENRLYWRDRLHSHVRLFGQEREIIWKKSPRYEYLLKAGQFQVGVPQEPSQEQVFPLMQAALKQLGKQYLTKRATFWAERTGLQPASIRIKHVKSRWGSCSNRRNVNLNWHLMLVDKFLSDYVIVHELAHLEELNHSRRFWVVSFGPFSRIPTSRQSLG